MKSILIALYLFLSGSGFLFSQEVLQITRERFGNIKIFELEVGDRMDYKLKGHSFYKHFEIADFQDTIVIFKNDQAVGFNEIKTIRVRKQQHLFRTFQGVFLIGGVGLFALSAFNNALLKNPPIISPQIAYISGGMLLASFIIYELGIKHIHLNKRTTLRVLNRDYNNLNVK